MTCVTHPNPEITTPTDSSKDWLHFGSFLGSFFSKGARYESQCHPTPPVAVTLPRWPACLPCTVCLWPLGRPVGER